MTKPDTSPTDALVAELMKLANEIGRAQYELGKRDESGGVSVGDVLQRLALAESTLLYRLRAVLSNPPQPAYRLSQGEHDALKVAAQRSVKFVDSVRDGQFAGREYEPAALSPTREAASPPTPLLVHPTEPSVGFPDAADGGAGSSAPYMVGCSAINQDGLGLHFGKPPRGPYELVNTDALDARRYRWLKARSEYCLIHPRERTTIPDSRAGWRVRDFQSDGLDFDSSIDAALAASGNGSGG